MIYAVCYSKLMKLNKIISVKIQGWRWSFVFMFFLSMPVTVAIAKQFETRICTNWLNRTVG